MAPRAVIWLGLAQQARLAAARLRDPELRRQLLIVAGCYERAGYSHGAGGDWHATAVRNMLRRADAPR